jgi:predicted DNA binding CopG/RHH family protein
MERLHMYINGPLIAWVKAKAEKDGISVAECIRRILDEARKKDK